MIKKYEFTDETIKVDGHTLHRIRAVRCFSDVKAGELGGWVEKEDNLSQMDNAWIGGDAKVYGSAKVCCDANVYGNAVVCGDAKVYGNAEVYDRAKVYDNARIYGDAEIYDDAKVYGFAEIWDNAFICDYAKVYGDAIVHNYAMVEDNARVFGNARVYGNARIYGDANVCGNVYIYGNALIYGDAKVFGDVEVFGEVEICGDAKVCYDADYIVFKNFWSSKRYFTWTRSNNMWRVGCFYGTGEELIEKAYRDSKKSGKEYERIVKYVESILADEEKTTQYLIQMKRFLSTVMRSIKRFGEKATEKLVSGESDKKFIKFFMVFTVIILLWYTVLAIFVWN